MDAPLSKVAPTAQCPPPTLVAPKAIGAMTHVSKQEAPKKQQILSTAECLRALNETDDNEDGLVLRNKKLHPLRMRPLRLKWRGWNNRKLLLLQLNLAPTSKKKKGAQRTKHLEGEQSFVVAVANDPQPTNIPPIRELRLFTLRKERELSPLLTWRMKFNPKHLYHPSTLVASNIKDHPPSIQTSQMKTLQGYVFLWPFSMRMLTTFKGDWTRNSNLQSTGCNFCWTLRKKLSHALRPCIRLMKLHHLLLHWINLQRLRSFLHQLGSIFTLRYPSLHP